MARRKDHTRDELRALILSAGHAHLAEVGLDGFTVAYVARQIGYAAGTFHNVVGDHHALMTELNTLSFDKWTDAVEQALAASGPDRIKTLVDAYFDFASSWPHLWMAIYDHRLPVGRAIPDDQAERRGRLTGVVRAEIAKVLPPERQAEAMPLTISLVATVHGHCALWLTGSLELLGEKDPRGMALARVREALGQVKLTP